MEDNNVKTPAPHDDVAQLKNSAAQEEETIMLIRSYTYMTKSKAVKEMRDEIEEWFEKFTAWWPECRHHDAKKCPVSTEPFWSSVAFDVLLYDPASMHLAVRPANTAVAREHFWDPMEHLPYAEDCKGDMVAEYRVYLQEKDCTPEIIDIIPLSTFQKRFPAALDLVAHPVVAPSN